MAPEVGSVDEGTFLVFISLKGMVFGTTSVRNSRLSRRDTAFAGGGISRIIVLRVREGAEVRG